MTRINTNVGAMISRHNLNRSHADMQVRLERLSTGLKINRGADNPSGLIVSERLRSEIEGVDQALTNAERAINVIATTEAALQEASTLLVEMKSLIIETANSGAFSKAEIEANQLQIDSAVESITRISNTASFAGLKLLNGSLDYVVSGVDDTALRDIRVYNSNFGTNPYMPVNVEVLDSAQHAELFLSGTTDPLNPGQLLSSVTFEVMGNYGVEVLQFVSGQNMSAVIFAINQVKDATGVSASYYDTVGSNPSSGVVLSSIDYGSDSFVSITRREDGDFFDAYTAKGGTAINRDYGTDVVAQVNGALALGDGLEISLRTSTLNLEFSITEAFNTVTGTSSSFAITGGGAKYQVGPRITTHEQINFGLQSVAASRLGNDTVGYLSSIVSGGANSALEGKEKEAAAILEKAIDQVAVLRGRLGAFQRNTLETTVRSQEIALESLTASESAIRDADFAAETSRLSRAQILVNAGTSTLAMANSTGQSVLSLLQ